MPDGSAPRRRLETRRKGMSAAHRVLPAHPVASLAALEVPKVRQAEPAEAAVEGVGRAAP